MSTYRLTSLAFLASSILAGTAMAQPQTATGVAAVAPSGEYNEIVDPSEVSAINGQLVPIGDHNIYKRSFKRFNVSANPIGWMFGFYGASGSYAFSQNIAIRAELDYVKPVDQESFSFFEADVGMPIYFRRAYQGLFLEPGLMLREYSYDYDFADDGFDESSSATEFGPQVLAGFHWTWDSGLNAAIAFGGGRNLSSDAESRGESSFVNGYLRFGYAF
jgi:hypothetical protein